MPARSLATASSSWITGSRCTGGRSGGGWYAPLDVVPSDAAYVRESLGHGRRPIEKPREIHTHLAPDAFTREDLAAVSVDLSDPKVIRLPLPAAASEPTGSADQREGGSSRQGSK